MNFIERVRKYKFRCTAARNSVEKEFTGSVSLLPNRYHGLGKSGEVFEVK